MKAAGPDHRQDRTRWKRTDCTALSTLRCEQSWGEGERTFTTAQSEGTPEHRPSNKTSHDSTPRSETRALRSSAHTAAQVHPSLPMTSSRRRNASASPEGKLSFTFCQRFSSSYRTPRPRHSAAPDPPPAPVPGWGAEEPAAPRSGTQRLATVPPRPDPRRGATTTALTEEEQQAAAPQTAGVHRPRVPVEKRGGRRRREGARGGREGGRQAAAAERRERCGCRPRRPGPLWAGRERRSAARR